MKTTQFDYNDFKTQAESFMTALTSELISFGIPADQLESDHLCFRVGTLEEYQLFKTELSAHGQLLAEAMVNGRPISTYRLNTPIQTKYHKVPLLELPAPKTGANYETGFEHAEFIIQECFQTFSSKFPLLKWTEGGNKVLNPELCLKLNQGIQAKFHHQTLARIIELEETSILDIIFDFDGTLINSRMNIHETHRIVFSNALNREIPLQEVIDKYQSEFPKLFDVFGVTCPIKKKEILKHWGKVSSQFNYNLFDGVLDTLTQLKKNNFRLHLWTARDEYSGRKILRELEIESFFTTFSFATEIDSKPHPNSLKFGWQQIPKDKVVVIGDTSTDILGAKNISAIRAAALWDVHTNKNSLISSGAELFFHHIEDFKNWLNYRP